MHIAGHRQQVALQMTQPSQRTTSPPKGYPCKPWRGLGFLSLDQLAGFVSGLLLCCAAAIAILKGEDLLSLRLNAHWDSHRLRPSFGARNRPQHEGKLVIYVFSNTDPEYYANFLFFIKHGVPGCDACEYIIVVDRGPAEPLVDLPQLPDNARYLNHTKECSDWGTLGWVFVSEGISSAAYKHFIFLNSSVRGPFLPAYLKGRVHFTELMTSKLVGDVKLVGPTINCGGTVKNKALELRQNPHVESYAMATDSVGLRLLRRDGRVFGCYDDAADTRWYSDLGSAAAILKANYTLDSFMSRYQGVDWRDTNMWSCNDEYSPYQYAQEDKVSLAPMELMFVAVNTSFLDRRVPSTLAATAYDVWYTEMAEGTRDLHRAPVVEQLWELRAPAILARAAIGLKCFDCEFYQDQYPEMASKTCWATFVHFINRGQFENRVYRFMCGTDLGKSVVPYEPPDDGGVWPRFVKRGCNNLIEIEAQSN